MPPWRCRLPRNWVFSLHRHSLRHARAAFLLLCNPSVLPSNSITPMTTSIQSLRLTQHRCYCTHVLSLSLHRSLSHIPAANPPARRTHSQRRLRISTSLFFSPAPFLLPSLSSSRPLFLFLTRRLGSRSVFLKGFDHGASCFSAPAAGPCSRRRRCRRSVKSKKHACSPAQDDKTEGRKAEKQEQRRERRETEKKTGALALDSMQRKLQTAALCNCSPSPVSFPCDRSDSPLSRLSSS